MSSKNLKFRRIEGDEFLFADNDGNIIRKKTVDMKSSAMTMFMDGKTMTTIAKLLGIKRSLVGVWYQSGGWKNKKRKVDQSLEADKQALLHTDKQIRKDEKKNKKRQQRLVNVQDMDSIDELSTKSRRLSWRIIYDWLKSGDVDIQLHAMKLTLQYRESKDVVADDRIPDTFEQAHKLILKDELD